MKKVSPNQIYRTINFSKLNRHVKSTRDFPAPTRICTVRIHTYLYTYTIYATLTVTNFICTTPTSYLICGTHTHTRTIPTSLETLFQLMKSLNYHKFATLSCN